MLLKPNTQLKHGEYRIDAVLGQGGFGITYLATQVALNRKVAIKEFFMKEFCERNADTSHVTLGTSGSREIVERFRAKFIKEAQHIAQLNHPHIVRIHDVFETNGTAYYVMEYHDGGSLADRVKQGPLPEAAAVDFVRQVAEALGYLHSRKMNHLDVKPGNILLDEEQRAVLIDFGLSKRYDEAGHQTSTTPVGISHGYAPMEQYNIGGVSLFSPETDIYALGATLYKLLSGETPIEAPKLINEGLHFPPTIPAHLVAPIRRAMSPAKRDRYSSVADFLQALGGSAASAEEPETLYDDPAVEDTILDDTPKSTPKPTPKPAPQPKPQPAPVPAPPKKRGGKKWLWTVVILLLVTGGFWGGRTAMNYIREQQAIADSIALAEAERAAFVQDSTEKANVAAEKAEKDRLAKEKAEKEKAEQERLAEEKAAKEKAEKERLAAEKAERERLAAEQAAKEKAEKERREREAREAAEKAERERLAREEAARQAAARAARGTINGHEWVDLGLSVKWATCNVGASSPSAYGNYYAWGETRTKSTYTEKNSVTYKKSMGDIAGNLNYDAARANWGGSWRLPTKSELEELKNNCTWTWTSQGGHNGYKVTGKNGNSIFLPAAGWRYGSSLDSAGEYGSCWSSSPYEGGSQYAFGLYFDSGNRSVDWSYRDDGRTVRPVSE